MEEQNGILANHVDTMKTAVARLEEETSLQQERNGALHKHLDGLKKMVVSGFQGYDKQQQLSMDNVDDFVKKLKSMLANPNENPAMLAKARDIVAKMDYKQLMADDS